MIVKVEEDEVGKYIILPDTIVKDYDIEVGDTAHMVIGDDHKTVEIFFSKGDENGNT